MCVVKLQIAALCASIHTDSNGSLGGLKVASLFGARWGHVAGYHIDLLFFSHGLRAGASWTKLLISHVNLSFCQSLVGPSSAQERTFVPSRRY